LPKLRCGYFSLRREPNVVLWRRSAECDCLDLAGNRQRPSRHPLHVGPFREMSYGLGLEKPRLGLCSVRLCTIHKRPGRDQRPIGAFLPHRTRTRVGRRSSISTSGGLYGCARVLTKSGCRNAGGWVNPGRFVYGCAHHAIESLGHYAVHSGQ